MRVSYVLITHNRRQRLLQTLQRLVENTALSPDAWEAIVVDNASTDDTVAAVHDGFPQVSVISLPENEGMSARNHAFPVARGRYLVLLDDDSYPAPGAIPAALNYLSRRPRVAAAVARVVLPSGAAEAPAFPCVLLGGASVVRKSVIDEVGGFAPEFFRQAEEYELSFRIWKAGYRIERFEDLIFYHDKETGGPRGTALTHRMDLRNNLILVERFFPRRLRSIYRHDWIRRDGNIALAAGHREAVSAALQEARSWAHHEALVGRQTLDDKSLQSVLDLKGQAQAVAKWKANGIERVVVADYSKNLHATWQACRDCGLQMLALSDDRAAFAGLNYRGVPILTPAAAIKLQPDGVIISNVNPAQVDGHEQSIRRLFAGPVLRLWNPSYLNPVRPAAAPNAA